MISVGTKELKNRLSHYLRRVREGEHVIVTDRGKPVAELRQLGERTGPEAMDSRLAALAAEGGVSLPADLQMPRAEPIDIDGPALGDAVIEDRR